VTSLSEQADARAGVLGQPGPRPAPLGAASELLPRRPYPGLRPFERSEWPIFRGRDRLIQDILNILAEMHFVSIVGPSGCGKSSLVRAGVLATLERRHGHVGVQWRTATMRPGGSPLWSMADGILRSLRPDLVGPDGELPADEVARLRVLIGTSQEGLAVVMREFALKDKDNESFLLLVDQFEEIFRYKPREEDEERTRFIDILVAASNDSTSGLYVITTMRSEYLGECARFTGLAETLNETHYLVPRMTPDELRQAIVEPAELKNGGIQEELVERLIRDLRSKEDHLPILQHALLWMWIRKEDRAAEADTEQTGIQLDREDCVELEIVENALSRHGDEIMNALTPEERRVAEVMFRRMVEVEESFREAGRPTRCGTVAELAQVSLDVVQRVVDAFRAEDASFIFANRERLTDDALVSVTHESLIRQWDTLKVWVRRERASYQMYDDLCRAAQRHEQRLEPLLEGFALSRALYWAAQEQPTRLWARRYGGDFDAAIGFLIESEEAEEAARRLRVVNSGLWPRLLSWLRVRRAVGRHER
jgi:energy-coupling factor transporter ATP-binding protein EcfA2